MTPSQIWYACAILLFILEMITPGFVLANVALAALAAAIVADIGGSLTWQLITFVVVGLVSFVTVRPFLRRPRASTLEQQPSEVDALLGRVVIVIDMITSDGTQGKVLVDGQVWRALSLRATEIHPNTRVRICGYESSILVVEETTS